MKKIFLYFFALAATVACNRVELDGDLSLDGKELASGVITEIISGSQGSSTKATIADTDASFSWSEGDHVAVHVSNGTYVFTSDQGAEGAHVDAEHPNQATFKVVYEAGYSRDYFAIYPSTIVSSEAAAASYGQDADHPLVVTLPSSYTLAQVSGTNGTTSPCPMISTNEATSTGWDFYQLCSLLRLTVSNIPATAKRLEIDFDGKKVWGDFSIAAAADVTPGTSVIATTADGDHDIITITKDGTDAVLGATSLVLNIPLPTGTYSNISIYAYDLLTGGAAVLSQNIYFSYTASNNEGVKRTSTLPGLFSVSAEKKVIFAPGNLQYLGKANGTGTWRFADHQYDFMGDGPSSGTSYQGNVTVTGYTKYNASADMDVARDLFGWGTSGYDGKYPYMTSSNAGSYYAGSLTDTDYDWGVYHSKSGNSTEKITNGGNYSWRLLTSVEWAYLINRTRNVYTRDDTPTYTQNKPLYAPATVVGVKGIILFPDNWTGALDRTIKYGKESNNNYGTTICDAEKWAKFEKHGCVFLPAAHVRNGTSFVSSLLNEGHYWASTVHSVLSGSEYRGGTCEFSNTGTPSSSSTNNRVRYFGQSVRLIRDAE